MGDCGVWSVDAQWAKKKKKKSKKKQKIDLQKWIQRNLEEKRFPLIFPIFCLRGPYSKYGYQKFLNTTTILSGSSILATKSSVVDPKRFDMDLDPTFHADADPTLFS